MSTHTRRDWILWGVLGCALVSTAHAEYTLATATHVNGYVALAVPGALDLYVIRALQQRRDVLAAVLVMVAVNVTSHLMTAGVLPVHWSITAAVGALAPLLLWRVHYLWRPTGAGSAPVPAAPDTAPAQVNGTSGPILCYFCLSELGSDCRCPSALRANEEMRTRLAPGTAPVQVSLRDWAPGYHLDGCDGQHQFEGPINCIHRADELEARTPDPVPDWMSAEYPPSAPHSDDAYKPQTTSAVPYLAPVPDLPAEYAASAVHEETSAVVLNGNDWAFVPAAEAYVKSTGKPSVKGLRREINVGQDRAERLLAHLGVRP